MFASSNVGPTDRVARIILGIILLLAPFLLGWSGAWLFAAVIAGVVLIFTALARFCPMYRLMGVSTCSRQME